MLIGALAGMLVGTVSAAARSVKAGWFAGGGAGLTLGVALLAGACLAPPRPPPFGPGRPINAAADADEERTLERNYLLWMAEQDQGERGAFILFIALPATLCAPSVGLGCGTTAENLDTPNGPELAPVPHLRPLTEPGIVTRVNLARLRSVLLQYACRGWG